MRRDADSPTPSKRKKIYIEKSFQFSFIIKVVLILILGGGISIALTTMTNRETLTTSYMNSRLVIENTSWAIMPSVIYTTLITTAVVGGIVVLITLFVSHKIAGPMFRFDKDIERITGGNLKHKICLRQGDQLTNIATSLNLMIDGLHGKVSKLQNDISKLHKEGETQTISPEFLNKLKEIEQQFEKQFKL